MATTKVQPENQTATPAGKGNKCKCGCGATVRSQFLPGHDARYASQIRKQVETGKLSRDEALRLASDVSPAFVTKVTKSLDSLAREQERAVARAQQAKGDNSNISARQGEQGQAAG